MVNMKTLNHHQYRCSDSHDGESGIALIMALLCLFVVSTLAVGVMYSTQSEIWTTANYRATTQARYIAEAGAQQTLNYLKTENWSDLQAKYPTGFNYTDYPTTPVIFATPGMPTRYPDTYTTAVSSATDQRFQTYFANSTSKTPFASVSSGARFDVAAQLLTMFTGTDGKVLTRWKIVSEGTLTSVGGKARVQVVEVVDNVIVPGVPGSSSSPTYAAGLFATGSGCGAITMSGNVRSNSYNSKTSPGSSPTLANTGGDIATYGNINLSGSSMVLGNVYTPFYNKGANGTYGISSPGLSGIPINGNAACSTVSPGTEWAVNESGTSQVGCNSSSCSQKTYALPSPAPSFPTPCLPSGNCPGVPATVAANTAACTGYSGLCNGGNGDASNGWKCSATIPPSTLPDGTAGSGPANFGKVNFGSCAAITLQAGTYNVDSLHISNGAKITLPASGNVIFNVLDNGSTAIPFNVDGGTMSNTGGDPSALTIVYAGTKRINIGNGANMFGTVYAPNATATIDGNAPLYGAMVCQTANISGSGSIYYDTNLAGKKWNVNVAPPSSNTGYLHVNEFSWSAF